MSDNPLPVVDLLKTTRSPHRTFSEPSAHDFKAIALAGAVTDMLGGFGGEPGSNSVLEVAQPAHSIAVLLTDAGYRVRVVDPSAWRTPGDRAAHRESQADTANAAVSPPFDIALGLSHVHDWVTAQRCVKGLVAATRVGGVILVSASLREAALGLPEAPVEVSRHLPGPSGGLDVTLLRRESHAA